jgi:hypothetical protein
VTDEPKHDELPPSTVALQIQQTIRNLVLATAFLAVVLLAAVGVGTYIASDQRHDLRTSITRNDTRIDDTNDSLCALVADLKRRVVVAQDLLRANPDGTPGIPAETLRATIDGQQRTILALSKLDCP